MATRKLIINAALAGFWAGVAVFTATNAPVDKALLSAVAVAALRGALGYAAAKVGKTVPVDA